MIPRFDLFTNASFSPNTWELFGVHIGSVNTSFYVTLITHNNSLFAAGADVVAVDAGGFAVVGKTALTVTENPS